MENADRELFKKIFSLFETHRLHELAPQERVIHIGQCFIGFPYRKGPLQREGREHLVVNLREQDCVTFVENTLALLYTLASHRPSFETFKTILKRIRYREGEMEGYPSRLHYFSEWIKDNERKGFIQEVSKEIGGVAFRKSLHYMTDHLPLYPPLRNPKNFHEMKRVERRISRKPFFFIPKENLPAVEPLIREGDLIAIVTRKEGLDIQHVGFAEKIRNRLYLLHASEKEGKVILSKETLYRYLMKNRESLGIRVARIKMG
jgi:hypothetical protein